MGDAPEKIERLLPHRGEALFVRAVLAHDATTIRCTCRVPPGSAYTKKDRATALLAPEFAAQAAAIHAGLTGDGAAPKQGFLVGIKELTLLAESFVADADLEIDVSCEQVVSPLSSWRFTLRSGSGDVARGVISLWQADTR